jgi:hypothetical protein
MDASQRDTDVQTHRASSVDMSRNSVRDMFQSGGGDGCNGSASWISSM